MARLYLILFYLFLGLLPLRAAELEWERGKPEGMVTITITGQIVNGDEEKFRQLVLRLIRDDIPIGHIRIHSPGGSVPAALHIGRQIRTLGLSTGAPVRVPHRRPNAAACVRRTFDHTGKMLPANKLRYWSHGFSHPPLYRRDSRCLCSSACFLIWTAGIGRYGNWIGVHRPIFDPKEYAKLSLREARRQYGEMVRTVKAYLKEMDIPDYIIRKMMAASSEEMHYLSAEQAKSLTNDAARQEWTIAKCGGTREFLEQWNAAVRRKDIRRIKELLHQQKNNPNCTNEINAGDFYLNLPAYLKAYGD
jgi:hypothetical protein